MAFGACSFPCSRGKSASFRRCGEKTILSSLGHIDVPRRYYACRACHASYLPWESWAGIDSAHRISPYVRRMIVLAGSSCSFDEAAKLLLELSHFSISNDTVRRVCDEEGQAVQQWMKQSSAPREAFAAAEGAVEVYTDGLKINTVGGWREIRQSVIDKRLPASAVPAEQWDQRVLEPPTVRVAVCAIAPCARIGAGWQRLAEALGLPKAQALSVIADGARWIWNQAARRFKGPDVQWVVDVYHLMLYLFAVVATRGPEAGKKWVNQWVIELIQMDGPKFIEHLKQSGPPDPLATTLAAWEKLLNYLEENRDSLWYGRRLAEGLPIGSGLIEGGGKSTLARRLKINSARWRIRRAERMGAIRCMQYSGMWERYREETLGPNAVAA